MKETLDLRGLNFEEGYIAVIDKPLSWTSTDVVRKIKSALRRLGYRKIKVGHAGTATLLAFAYYAKPRQKETISYRDALIIGLAQACAAMPGLSRSGTTIATGLLLGNKKAAVAQFSFLMVLAPILGETLLEAASGDLTAGIATGTLAAGFAASFITGCLACKFMIEIVKRGKLIWFSLYCALAGLVSILSYFC